MITPAAVFKMIGQILEIKITQIEAGSAALNTNKPIGNHAKGDTGRNNEIIGAKHLINKLHSSQNKAQWNTNQRGQTKT